MRDDDSMLLELLMRTTEGKWLRWVMRMVEDLVRMVHSSEIPRGIQGAALDVLWLVIDLNLVGFAYIVLLNKLR